MVKSSIIAIDGPVAAGKTTTGILLADSLEYSFIDTGVMYRALTWKALKLNIPFEDEEEHSRLAANTEIEFAVGDSGHRHSVLVDGQDITSEVHSLEVEAAVSLVAKVAGVRRVLVEQQRQLAQNRKVVMVGRDIGTTVLPHAELKIYLEASVEERAKRRYLEIVERGETVDYHVILSDLIRRDEIDSKRSISPLEVASDAKVINTDNLNPDQVLSRILSLMD
jgi:cytidylate kinase